MLPPAYFAAHLGLMVLFHFACPLVQWNLGMSRWAGLPFAALGLLVVLASIGRFRGATTRHPFERPEVLVTDGFYRFSRNPMYAGLLLSLIGAGIMLGSATPLIAIPLFVWLITARFIVYEEQALASAFGEAYETYRRRVRRWF